MLRYFLIISYLLILSPIFAQQDPKRLYLANDTHVDLMYNADEEKWAKLILEMADFYLGLGEGSIKEESARQSKWNYDCSYWLWVLEHRTSPEYFARIIAQIKNQQASVPYNFTLPIYGASTPESILRSYYYSGYLERKYGIDVDIAVCQENATVPLGLASLWAGSGALYSWKGVCNCATKSPTKGVRQHEIYRYKGLDSTGVLMKWYSNFGWNAELGGYAEMLEPTIAVIQMDTMSGTKRYPYRVAGAFGRGWDNMVNYAYDVQWGIGHRTRPGTKVFVSNQLDFFRDFEKTYGNQLPSESVAYGNEWDLLPATLMNVSGGIRRSMEKLRAAEAMASIVVSTNPKAFDNLKAQKQDFLYGLSVISAHGWTIDGPIGKTHFTGWARKQERNIALYVDALYDQSAKILSEKIITVNGAKRFFAFNTLNWERTDFADYEYDGSENISVKDIATNRVVASQFILKNNKKYLRILAEKIPSMGYKVFEIQNVSSKTNTSKVKITGQTIETPFHKISVTKAGVIKSLIDKITGKNVAKNLNDLGNKDTEESTAKMIIENVGAVSTTIKFESDKPIKHISRITVFSNIPRIDIENEVHQNFSEPVYQTFNFNLENANVWHEEIGAVIKAKKVSEGGHYSDYNARYDHQSLNHFADISNAQSGVTLSVSDCLFMKLGNSTPEKLDSQSSTINVMIGGQVDKNFNLGVNNQGGDSLFYQHYSLQTHGANFDQTKAMQFSMEHQNSLVTKSIIGGNELNEKQYSFLKTTDPSLIVWSLKPAEDLGVALRFWNMANRSTESDFMFEKPLRTATESTHVETDITKANFQANRLTIKAKQQQMKTYRVEF